MHFVKKNEKKYNFNWKYFFIYRNLNKIMVIVNSFIFHAYRIKHMLMCDISLAMMDEYILTSLTC